MKTKLILEIGDTVTTWERDGEDCSIEDLCWGFMSVCIGQTFYPSVVSNGMFDFAKSTQKSELS
jgi:hypothetical protein